MTERQQDIIAKILLAGFLVVIIPIAIAVILLEWVTGKKFISEAR